MMTMTKYLRWKLDPIFESNSMEIWTSMEMDSVGLHDTTQKRDSKKHLSKAIGYKDFFRAK